MSRDNYSIIYENKRCNHPKLRGFKDKNNYICLSCGVECQFCNGCEKVFTVKTLAKSKMGLCGTCEKYERDYKNFCNCSPYESKDYNNYYTPPSYEPPLLAFDLLFQNLASKTTKKKSTKTPISEMRQDLDFSSDEETIDSVVKNILAEDSAKKLWLVEWEGEKHATWESYDTLKDNKIFKKYIENKMSD